MKINQGSSALIEQMRQAHAEGKAKSSKTGEVFSLPQQVAESSAGPAANPMESSLMSIAQKVVEGDINDPVDARRQVIAAIVDERYGAMIEPEQRAQTLSMLEHTLVDDPQFSKEVDHMLILASQQLATRG